MKPMLAKTLLIKVGGSVLHEEESILSLCNSIKQLSSLGYAIVLVHGGSKAINQNLAIHNIKSEFIDGLRVTSQEAIKIIEMVLCGQVNQHLVRKLNNIGTHAVGLSGADHQLLQCRMLSQIHGYVGEIQTVNTTIIHQILQTNPHFPGVVPVIASIGIDNEGNALNINADQAACQLAIDLGVKQLIFLTDQTGIDDEAGIVYESLNAEDIKGLIHQNTVKDGMLVKAKAILTGLNAGISQIHVLNGQHNQALLDTIIKGNAVGTVCTNAFALEKIA